MVNEYVISIGSNVPETARGYVESAMRFMENLLAEAKSSSVYSTPSVNGDGTMYFNAVVKGFSPLDSAQIQQACKDYETASGRTKTAPYVVIDLDLVMANGCVVRPKDASKSYFTIGFNELS
ncbi:MAG: 2-amino-4-hydroxy-6-hydroxymethyldihydropteridine diphosphokinase [Firmicutes bacterium]|nr:2-amino-4-hydroxy-6-hydroxymethyldihydropteridine diphosphokinase [Bacillota bacterium]MCM1400805.1 2-amino-4-hydroxy-6-hydroxymethyldihydropteridine diphosphokinase [Bacteroides sp.]MCM1477658.1 2-amino-4-hydroxy-6-hydroxymethyldihydropteridine diphosphokinase [Bacteroides sp.]